MARVDAEAGELGADGGDVGVGLGVALVAPAAAACEQALRYKPDFDLARNNLQYARSRLGR